MKPLHFSLVFIFAALAINSFTDAKIIAKRQWDWNNNFMAIQEESNENANNLSERKSEYPTNEEYYEDVSSKQAENDKPVEVETVAFSAVIVQAYDSPNATEQGEDENQSLLGESELATASPDDSNEEDERGLQHKKLSLGKLGKIIKGGLGGKGKGGRGGRLGGRGCKRGRKGCGGKRPRKPCPNGKKRCGIGRQLGGLGRRILEKIPMGGGGGGGYDYPGGDDYPDQGGYEDNYGDEYYGGDDNNGGHHGDGGHLGGDDGFGFGTDFDKTFDIHIDI